MTDTTILPTTPAYVQISDAHRHGGHHNHGVTDKDRMHMDSDALNSALRGIVSDISATTVSVEKNGRSSELATEKTAASIQLANSLAFANTQNLLIGGFKDGRYDAAVNAAAVALAGATNTASIMAANAECCCEIKERIREDGEKTRDLISSVNSANLAVQLADAKNTILALSLKVPTLAV